MSAEQLKLGREHYLRLRAEDRQLKLVNEHYLRRRAERSGYRFGFVDRYRRCDSQLRRQGNTGQRNDSSDTARQLETEAAQSG